jgi:hypothetical protein
MMSRIAFTPGLRFFGDDRGEILLAIIDRLPTQFADCRAFIGTAGGGEGFDAEFAAEHQCGGADAAGATVDQHALTALNVAEAEQVGPHGKEGFRDRGGLHPVQASGIGKVCPAGTLQYSA